MTTIRIATRKSPLALWQAEYVKDRLLAAHPGIKIELLKMTTQGDKILDTPLAKVGGKGLFVKELEQGMLRGEADIAVHSMKDVPVDLPEGLHISTICPRENPHDAFVSNRFSQLTELPQGAVVGTSSLRRQCQLRHLRPDLVIKDLRGNVNTRLKKLDDEEFDAIILAGAGLLRLKFEDRIKHFIPAELSLPAIGQGAVGIECRSDDKTVNSLLSPLHDEKTAICVRAERALNARLEGGCQVPIGGHAILKEGRLWIRGLVGQTDGMLIVRSELTGDPADGEKMGVEVAEDLLSQGADKILQQVYGKA